MEKKQYGWKNRYGEEKEKYLLKEGIMREKGMEWNREELEEVIEMERNKMRREEEERI